MASIVPSGFIYIGNYTKSKSEPQNIECRISNDEGWNRFAQSFLKQTEYIHSTFDVGRSMFDVHQFLFRLDWPLFRPEAALVCNIGVCVRS